MEIREMTIKDYDKVYNLWEETEIILKKSDEKQEIDRMIKRNPYTCLVGIIENEIVTIDNKEPAIVDRIVFVISKEVKNTFGK